MVRTRDSADRWEEAALSAFISLGFLFAFLKEFFQFSIGVLRLHSSLPPSLL